MQLSYSQKQDIYENGYVVVPGVIPPIMVKEARKRIHADLGTGQPSNHSNSPEITDLFNKTPLDPLIHSVVDDFHPIRGAQVALRFPTYDDPAPPAHAHLDGMLQVKNGEVQNFTALVGVLLSDLTEVDAGNFTVWPGTHRAYQDYFREHGPNVLLSEESFRDMHRSPNVPLPSPVQITGKAGDVIIAHYQLIHAAGPNIMHDIRYACFFRVDHVDRARDWRAPLTDIWMHWPGMKPVLESR